MKSPALLLSFLLPSALAYGQFMDNVVREPTPLAFQPRLGNMARAPAPTPAPEPGQIRRKLRRQNAYDTCGWVSGEADDPVTCDLGYNCATNAFYGVGGCCSGFDFATCILQTTCLDSSQAVLVSATIDAFTGVCDDGIYNVCKTFIYPGDYSAFGCDSTKTIIRVSTTLAGGASATLLGSSVSITVSAPPASSVINAPAQTTIVQVSDNSSSNSSKGLSTGAIVGIAIAGAVVLVTAIGVIGFVCYKRNKRNASVVPQPPPMAYNPNSPQQGPPSNWQGSHAGHFSQTSQPGVMGGAGVPTSPGGADSSQVGSSHAGQSGTGFHSNAGGAGGTTATRVQSQASSHDGSGMTQANMNAMLAGHATDEWGFVQRPVPQKQSAAAHEDDGIKMTEIAPEEAVDEPHQQQAQQAQYAQHFGGAGGTGVGVVGGGAPQQFVQHYPQQHPNQQQQVPYQIAEHPGQQQQQGQGHDVMSTVAPTAVAPTMISHHVPNL